MSHQQKMNNKNQEIPVMKAEHFIHWINPHINQAVYKAQQKRKRRKETICFILGYLFFLFFAGTIYLDYRVNGLLNCVPFYLCLVGIFSFGLILYVPLLIKLKKVNGKER